MGTKPLSVDLVKIDGGTQSRLKIDDDVVSDYAEIIKESNGDWPFPPLDVFSDGTDYFLGDGFHRFLAAQRAKRGSVPCKEHKGTAYDARIFGMTANDKHGLRMTRADKRACVEWLLDQPGKMTQKDIAEKAGVTTRTVKNIVAERKPDPPADTDPSEELGKISPTTMGGDGRKIPYTPSSGVSDPFDEVEDPFSVGDAEDEGMEPVDEQEPASRPPGNGKEESAGYGKCPNCAGTKWDEDEDGVSCARCHHPWGEPAGDVDEDRLKTQRQKTVKTVEALMRAFDDLQMMLARPEHDETIQMCKTLLKAAKGWK